MKKLVLSTLVLGVIGATSLVASGNTQTGCGLGNQIIKHPNSAVLYAIQATLNSTFGAQTFGITSGTVGCKKVKFMMNERAQEFVASNMDSLAKEMAKGQGESIETLAELLEIKNKQAFFATLQASYNDIYTNDHVKMSDVLENVSASI